MKKLLFIIVILHTVNFAQGSMNPDGYIGGLSLHVTPYSSLGEKDIEVNKIKAGTIDYPAELNFEILIAIPLSSSFTIKAFYEYQRTSYKFVPMNIDNYYLETSKGLFHVIGATFSFYFGKIID